MITTSFLISKITTNKSKKSAGGGRFKDKFWDSFEDDDLYDKQKAILVSHLDSIEDYSDNKDNNLYFEVELNSFGEDKYISKSNRPSKIWDSTQISEVASHLDKFIVVSGKYDDFVSLKKEIQDSSFVKAKEKNSKADTNIAREAFSISGIQDLNKNLYGRTDSYTTLYFEEEQNQSEEIECIIELYPNIEVVEYEKFYNIIKEFLPQLEVNKRDIETFVNNISYLGLLKSKDFYDILGDDKLNFISYITINEKIISSRSIESNKYNIKVSNDRELDEIVGIFDSGIDSDFLGNLVETTENYSTTERTDCSHGTFVASRLLFGDRLDDADILTKDVTLDPLCKILDIKILNITDDGLKTNNDIIKSAINNTIRKYTHVDIYNISVNSIDGNKSYISEITEFIDTLVYRHDKIFVLSAGNHDWYKEPPFQEMKTSEFIRALISNESDIYISAPGDCINGITVGSISNKVDEECFTKEENCVSPFSRIGGYRDIKKPDIVYSGGNVMIDEEKQYYNTHMQISNRKYGILGFDGTDWIHSIGTSFSAPTITNYAVQILNFFKKTNLYQTYRGKKIDFVKGILVHSTKKIAQKEFEESNLGRYGYGFGQVPNLEKIVKDGENEATFVQTGAITLEDKEKIHKLGYNIPSSMLNKKLRIIFTLCYTPPVNKNFVDYYNSISLSASLKANSNYLKSNGESYSNSNYNIIQFDFTRKFKKQFNLNTTITMNLHPSYESKFKLNPEEIRQNYMFFITIIDLEGKTNIKEELFNTGQFEIMQEVEIPVAIPNQELN